jgi:hypothetical protein
MITSSSPASLIGIVVDEVAFGRAEALIRRRWG